ncbi:hypothetical protein T492DRAFT_1134587 [Pavlovales sp. CCMP2436]|nr:hypothetical protein T492DRAFT_1134587 [Pavlovales sp. CCMP2436]
MPPATGLVELPTAMPAATSLAELLPHDCVAHILCQLATVRDRCIAMGACSDWRAAGLWDATLWRDIHLPTANVTVFDLDVDRLLVRARGGALSLRLDALSCEISGLALGSLRHQLDLHTLDVHAPRISGTELLAMLPADKSSLRVMNIAGCRVSLTELRTLQEELEDAELDIGACTSCDVVRNEDDLSYCESCVECTCFECIGDGCDICLEMWCNACAEADNFMPLITCAVCESERVCADCLHNPQVRMRFIGCDGCGDRVCRDCISSKEDAITICSHCHANFCGDCAMGMSRCTGCNGTICIACEE